jgi:hypothetical protein
MRPNLAMLFAVVILQVVPILSNNSHADTSVDVMGVKFRSNCWRPNAPFMPIYDRDSAVAAVNEAAEFRRRYDDYMECVKGEMVKDLEEIQDGLGLELKRIREEANRDIEAHVQEVEGRLLALSKKR